MPFVIQPRGEAFERLQSTSFALTRTVHLEVEERTGGELLIGVWDLSRKLRIGSVRGAATESLMEMMALADTPPRTLVIWQWRDRETDKRTAIKLLATRFERLLVAVGPLRHAVELNPGDSLF